MSGLASYNDYYCTQNQLLSDIKFFADGLE